jgi:hypothetical protein
MLQPLTSVVNPYIGIAKIVAGLAMIAAVVGFIWSWQARGAEIKRLEGLQTVIVQAATNAVVAPDEDGQRAMLQPEDVPAAINALSASLTSAESTLRRISAGTMTAKAASDAADARLSRQIEDMQRRANQAGADNWNPWGDQP